MRKVFKHIVLIAGILSPFAALFLYAFVYTTLTSRSTDLEKDWLFRLAASTFAMTIPFLITLALFIKDQRRNELALSGKIGLAIAVLSLGLAWKPVNDGILRSRQVKNLAKHDVPAPLFDTADLLGKTQRLEDHKGQVVLVNIWATWCGPCRAEMPRLNQLYEERQQQGFIVFGISDETVEVQKKFQDQVQVSYPLLTHAGNVPDLYRDIAKYPAIFLIDRQGRLQPAPSPDEPFEKLQASVDALLKSGS